VTETDLMNSIRLELSKLGYVVFRINVGNFYTKDGRYIKSTVPKGFSDLFAIKDGKVSFIEVKVKPNKPTKEQINFIEQMKSKGCNAGVAYAVDEAKQIVGGYESETSN